MRSFQGTRKYPRILQLIFFIIVFAAQVPKRAKFARTSKVFEVSAARGTRNSTRGSCMWVQSSGARTSKVSEVSAVSEVIETLKRGSLQGPRMCLAENFCPVASLAGR